MARTELLADRFLGRSLAAAEELAANLGLELRVIDDEPYDWNLSARRMNAGGCPEFRGTSVAAQ